MFRRGFFGAIAGGIAALLGGTAKVRDNTTWIPDAELSAKLQASGRYVYYKREVKDFSPSQIVQSWRFGDPDMDMSAANGHIALPSDDGSVSYSVSTPPLSERMERLSFFDTIRCECCGVTWSEHTESCFNHRHRDNRIALFVECVRSGKYKHDHVSAVRNGLEVES